MKKMFARVRAIVNRPRVMHYLDVFVAATAVDLAENEQHILGAHGLNALKSVATGAAIIGVKAVIEAYRKSVPTGPSK